MLCLIQVGAENCEAQGVWQAEVASVHLVSACQAGRRLVGLLGFTQFAAQALESLSSLHLVGLVERINSLTGLDLLLLKPSFLCFQFA
ncbi:hypothetical protein D3C85_1711120 [compost metagenome]